MSQFSEWLVSTLRRTRWSVDEVASATGLCKTDIEMYTEGRGVPSVAELYLLCDLLGADLRVPAIYITLDRRNKE